MNASIIADALSALLLLGACFFFAAGTVGLLRFPDSYTRLHALTKADSVGLGLTVTALLVQAPGALAALKLLVVWLLSLFASATIANLVANLGLREGRAPWKRR